MNRRSVTDSLILRAMEANVLLRFGKGSPHMALHSRSRTRSHTSICECQQISIPCHLPREYSHRMGTSVLALDQHSAPKASLPSFLCSLPEYVAIRLVRYACTLVKCCLALGASLPLACRACRSHNVRLSLSLSRSRSIRRSTDRDVSSSDERAGRFRAVGPTAGIQLFSLHVQGSRQLIAGFGWKFSHSKIAPQHD